MPRKPDPTLKPAIIAKVTDHLLETKVEDVSVRSLGRVLGTSAYPIVYHFGSREALIDAVLDHLHAPVADVALDPTADSDALRTWLTATFGGLDDPERALAARLTFELGAVEELGGRTREHTAHGAYVATLAAWCRAHGHDDRQADRAARAAVHTARGIQWGAVVDRHGTDVDAALLAVADDLARRVTLASA